MVALLNKRELIEQLQALLIKMTQEVLTRHDAGEPDPKLAELTRDLDTIIDAATE